MVAGEKSFALGDAVGDGLAQGLDAGVSGHAHVEENKPGYLVGVLKASETGGWIQAAAKELMASDENAVIQKRWSPEAR